MSSPHSYAEAYRRDGYVSAVPIIGLQDAQQHRTRLEHAESQVGPLHYQSKIHTLLRSPLELATQPQVLDIVEAILGPDILLYNATYIIKEPHTPSHVSWHQDLTFWGLSGDQQVSMWLALSAASAQSGCMRMLPGSHQQGCLHHETSDDESNVLLQGQTVQGIDESQSVMCPLAPGEASFHHGWTLHASMPNLSDDRRIGLNVQYLAPSVYQTKTAHERDSAMLVRGQDRYGHWETDLPATQDLHPDAMRRHRALQQKYLELAGTQ